jgi:predicted DNA-binding transcriptional regulator AlpA
MTTPQLLKLSPPDPADGHQRPAACGEAAFRCPRVGDGLATRIGSLRVTSSGHGRHWATIGKSFGNFFGNWQAHTGSMNAPDLSSAILPKSVERPTISAEEAFAHLGIDRTTGYRAIRQGRFPVEVIRIGRVIRVPTNALRRLLELDAGHDADRRRDGPTASGTLAHRGPSDGQRNARDVVPIQMNLLPRE